MTARGRFMNKVYKVLMGDKDPFESSLCPSLSHRKSPDLRRSMSDIRNTRDCVDVTRSLTETQSSTDDLCTALVRLYSRRLPKESELRTLSLLQQQVYGTYGVEEYAVTTLWLCALQSIMESELRRATVRTSRSHDYLGRPRPPRLQRAASF